MALLIAVIVFLMVTAGIVGPFAWDAFQAWSYKRQLARVISAGLLHGIERD